jgi:hypothetical protein
MLHIGEHPIWQQFTERWGLGTGREPPMMCVVEYKVLFGCYTEKCYLHN